MKALFRELIVLLVVDVLMTVVGVVDEAEQWLRRRRERARRQ